jgi:hypothetical protein
MRSAGELVSWFLCFLVEQQEEIAWQHAVEVVKLDLLHFALSVRAADNALIVHVHVYPILDVLEITRIACAFVDEILTVKLKRFRVAPRAEICAVG